MANPGNKSGKVMDKSNFAQTCNLLSQYLKEKGSFGEISLGMAGKLETKGKPEAYTTMNLLPTMENSAEPTLMRQNSMSSSTVKSMDFFPQFSSFVLSTSMEDTPNKASSKNQALTETGTSQMTIFYAGKVLVFNDFPAEKAREIMALANKGNYSNNSSTTATEKIILPTSTTTTTTCVAPDLNMVSTSGHSNSTQEVPLCERPAVGGSDLPIARRASLHRFLEKRKDRVAAKAPYQVYNHSTAALPPPPPKPEENNFPWFDLDGHESSKQLDLKLW